jgi:hypothetical protein
LSTTCETDEGRKKLKRNKITNKLRSQFKDYGKIIGLNYSRLKTFVCFEVLESAIKVKNDFNDKIFFGQPMKINFARENSHVLNTQKLKVEISKSHANENETSTKEISESDETEAVLELHPDFDFGDETVPIKAREKESDTVREVKKEESYVSGKNKTRKPSKFLVSPVGCDFSRKNNCFPLCHIPSANKSTLISCPSLSFILE